MGKVSRCHTLFLFQFMGISTCVCQYQEEQRLFFYTFDFGICGFKFLYHFHCCSLAWCSSLLSVLASIEVFIWIKACLGGFCLFICYAFSSDCTMYNGISFSYWRLKYSTASSSIQSAPFFRI